MYRVWEKLCELTWPSTWYGWRLGLQSWWYTRDKYRLTVATGILALLLAIPPGIFILFNQAQQSQQAARDLRCLTLNIYHEARGESLAGQYAVAEVTLNRVASERFPDTLCGVVYEQRWDRIRERHVGAFSWTEIDRNTAIDGKALRTARRIASTVYKNKHNPRVNGALFYHADHIQPSWARKKVKVATIGRHIFYK